MLMLRFSGADSSKMKKDPILGVKLLLFFVRMQQLRIAAILEIALPKQPPPNDVNHQLYKYIIF